MRHFLAVLMFQILLLPQVAFSEIKTVTHTLKQPFGGSQSPDDARVAGLAKAKREALERFGTYIESTTIVKDSKVDSDEILALTAGVTKAEVVSQRSYADGDAFGIEITVKVELDTDVLDASLKQLLSDRQHLKEMIDARIREKQLLLRIDELERLDKKAGKTLQETAKLNSEFKVVSQALTVVDMLDQALDLSIKIDADTYSREAAAFVKRNQLDQAITYYDRAIQLDSNDAKKFNNRGNIHSDLKHYEKAISDYTQAINLSPKDAIYYYNRGSAYLSGKRFALAVADFDISISLDSSYANAYNNRGLTFFHLSQFFSCCDDLIHACKLGVCSGYEFGRQKGLCP